MKNHKYFKSICPKCSKKELRALSVDFKRYADTFGEKRAREMFSENRSSAAEIMEQYLKEDYELGLKKALGESKEYTELDAWLNTAVSSSDKVNDNEFDLFAQRINKIISEIKAEYDESLRNND